MNEKTCNDCGVILDADMDECPLCGHREEESKKESKGLKLPRKGLMWELFSIILGAAALIILVTDYAGERTLEWSAIPVGSIIYVWLLLTFMHIFGERHLYFMFFLHYLSTIGLLILIDSVHIPITWVYSLGIPIATLVSLSLIAGAASLRRCRFPGLQLLGHWFVILALFPVGLQTAISIHLGQFHLSWSLIACISLIPAALLFYYLHYRMKLWIDLRNYFHV
jgi:hypothetical protein